MKFFGYGIFLERLTRNDLELVRYWRNSEEVNSFMIYQNEISEQQQQDWFDSINNDQNYYFIILNKREEKVGLVNIKDVDFINATGEAGVFMFGQKNWGTGIALKAGALAGRFAFENLKLASLTCKVTKENKRAVTFNQYFGYQFSISDTGILHGFLKRENFFRFLDRYVNVLER